MLFARSLAHWEERMIPGKLYGGDTASLRPGHVFPFERREVGEVFFWYFLPPGAELHHDPLEVDSVSQGYGGRQQG
jgi:hypothetical protein